MHDRIEAIAGAIALGEAGDEDRRVYREHIATCRDCLNELGGEREIERVAATVHSARDAEVWQPDLRSRLDAKIRRGDRRLRSGAAIVAAAICASFGVHALVASRVPAPPATPAAVAMNAPAPQPLRVRIERRRAQSKAAPAAAPQRRLIVQHNVIQLQRAPLAVPPVTLSAPVLAQRPPIADVTVHAPLQAPHPAKSHQSNVPVWRRGGDAWRTLATTTTTSLTESAPQTLTHRAESLQVFSSHYTRDAMPIGGETAISPQPPMIAYDEGAQGTSAFEVLIDDRGNPTRCVITKPAGYPVLDKAVCAAAMQARYTPKTVDGRAVPGVYRDAFTFRMTDNQNIEGVPKPIP